MAKIREKSGGGSRKDGSAGGGVKKSKKGAAGGGTKAHIRAARYFSSLAPSPSPKPEGGDKIKDKAARKKNIRKNNKAGSKEAPKFQTKATPKPKRLKKGPFKVKSSDDAGKEGKDVQKKIGKQEVQKAKGSSPGKQDVQKTKGASPGKFKKTHKKKVNRDQPVPAKQTEDTKKRITNFKQGNPRQLPKQNLKMIVKLAGKWYAENPVDKDVKPEETPTQHDEIIQPTVTKILRTDEVNRLRKSAEQLLENDCQAYKQFCVQGEQKADFNWMEKMMRIGTLPDKMAAYVVKIQDSPVHNIHHLQNLISMVKVQSKQQCLMAADTLKDLFLEDLLPPSRKLITFEKRGSSLSQATKFQLILWIYEDRLKMCYNSFLDALRRMSLDNIDKVRAKAVVLMYTLLTAHPEHEAELLQMLVNKLGDPIKKVGSRALFYLNSLLANHPRMKMVVIDEVERLLFRNNIAKRAQYYGVCFLNTINLEDEHPEVAVKLINVYVAFFKGCVKTGDIDSKMMSGLLTGLNKAYPLAKEFGFKFTENADTLYKIVHMSSFNISLQALSILFQLTDPQNHPTEADRYYRALYSVLLHPEIAITSHSTHFLNLVFKSMKHDTNINRVMGFCKRLMQICQSVPPNLACAILFLLSEVSKTHINIIRVGTGTVETSKDDDSVCEDGSDIESDRNARNDENMKNLIKISNVKVIDEMSSAEKPTKTLLGLGIGAAGLKNNQFLSNKADETKDTSSMEGGNLAIEAQNENAVVKMEYKNQLSDYDPNARNPMYCGAEFSLSHEIITLADHYHPSVAVFAKTLLQKGHIVYQGNPLKDFTITRFLERFVYKNPKKPKVTPGVPRQYQPKGLRNIPVNSNDYLRNEESKIPEEEKFFYRYFTEKKAEKSDADVESETESVGDDEFDELMDNYFKSSKGKDADEDDFDVDFAANLQNTKLSGKKRKKGGDDSESDEDEVDDQYDEDSEGDEFGPADDADEMLELDDDDDDDDLDFEEEDGVEVYETDDEIDVPVKKTKIKKLKGADMFAPAEQFAEMLESNADFSLSGPGTLINKDNADPKQLRWEVERDRWMKGFKGSSKTTFKNKRKRQK
ncbi:unnamed protein product [Orchesella dallaii]|uniref:CCAAT-binding factor domain-containing protein n=1 Tax=Orchesella dallaii TaxID=48710 RepID=A0ABP1QDV2_9HEXA